MAVEIFEFEVKPEFGAAPHREYVYNARFELLQELLAYAYDTDCQEQYVTNLTSFATKWYQKASFFVR